MNEESRSGEVRVFQFSLMSALVMITVAAALVELLRCWPIAWHVD